MLLLGSPTEDCPIILRRAAAMTKTQIFNINSKMAGLRDIIECMTCKMWGDLKSCKGLTEMSQSERNKLVFECWKCIVDERVKMANVNMKMEHEIKRLMAEAVVSLRKELDNERKLKGGEDVRSKRKVDGDVNDGARCTSERDEWSRVNEKMNGSWAKVNGKRMIEKNGINDDERNRINEKMNGFWIKVGGRINEMDAMKEVFLRKQRPDTEHGPQTTRLRWLPTTLHKVKIYNSQAIGGNVLKLL
ncbi:hypothetical protein FHG87_024032 [Trinorchestia longiramus]|nr:hypothetical protein FHG87_024032 [Trinorchestia longiramus]